MLQLLRILVIIVAVFLVNNNKCSIVKSETLPFCGYSPKTWKTSTCPGDYDKVEIPYPFWIENNDSRVDDKGRDCMNYYPGFQIECAANGRPVINISSNLYHVLDIYPPFGGYGVIRVVDVDIDAQECLQPRRNISIPSELFLDNTERIVFYNINYRVPVSCGNCKLSGGECWANETNLPVTTSFHCNCKDDSYTYQNYYNSYSSYTHQGAICPGEYYNSYYRIDEGLSLKMVLFGVSMGIGGLLLSLLVLCRRKCYPLFNTTISRCISRCRKKIKGPTNVEMFLDNNNEGISSHNFKYSDIKKMTNSFKDTLGQGGYGSVFKGKLRDGRLVAVKLLTESKGKGEDFINEVATIGTTNHVNVVSLLGFCAEGTKRALVYEFMPNGSLEKFIHNTKDSSITSSLLGWEKLYQIALGIARGLDYLHRGCNTRILHFDIKPHNILLDLDFCPKISDFGLAKLCPTKASLVSMVGARGTPGYIAPELYCGNFGGVSHKSDVYSYGMMVLEIIGGRKNMDLLAENASQIYFPQWIYKRLIGNIEVEESGEIEAIVTDGGVLKEETARKMIVVALWCIQAHPGDRPSMTKVVDMLEGNTEDLQFPPNPFPSPSTS